MKSSKSVFVSMCGLILCLCFLGLTKSKPVHDKGTPTVKVESPATKHKTNKPKVVAKVKIPAAPPKTSDPKKSVKKNSHFPKHEHLSFHSPPIPKSHLLTKVKAKHLEKNKGHRKPSGHVKPAHGVKRGKHKKNKEKQSKHHNIHKQRHSMKKHKTVSSVKSVSRTASKISSKRKKIFSKALSHSKIVQLNTKTTTKKRFGDSHNHLKKGHQKNSKARPDRKSTKNVESNNKKLNGKGKSAPILSKLSVSSDKRWRAPGHRNHAKKNAIKSHAAHVKKDKKISLKHLKSDTGHKVLSKRPTRKKQMGKGEGKNSSKSKNKKTSVIGHKTKTGRKKKKPNLHSSKHRRKPTAPLEGGREKTRINHLKDPRKTEKRSKPPHKQSKPHGKIKPEKKHLLSTNSGQSVKEKPKTNEHFKIKVNKDSKDNLHHHPKTHAGLKNHPPSKAKPKSSLSDKHLLKETHKSRKETTKEVDHSGKSNQSRDSKKTKVNAADARMKGMRSSKLKPLTKDKKLVPGRTREVRRKTHDKSRFTSGTRGHAPVKSSVGSKTLTNGKKSEGKEIPQELRHKLSRIWEKANHQKKSSQPKFPSIAAPKSLHKRPHLSDKTAHLKKSSLSKNPSKSFDLPNTHKKPKLSHEKSNLNTASESKLQPKPSIPHRENPQPNHEDHHSRKHVSHAKSSLNENSFKSEGVDENPPKDNPKTKKRNSGVTVGVIVGLVGCMGLIFGLIIFLRRSERTDDDFVLMPMKRYGTDSDPWHLK